MKNTPEKLYFLRIGGTAMGGVAAACQANGDEVYGSEEVIYEPMKSYLADAGVQVIPSFDPSNLERIAPNRVVVGNAVTRGNLELEAAMNARLTCVSLPQIVNEKLIRNRTSVVITGTHGKTTTTAMTANMLQVGGLEPGFLIGGVPGNFDVSCRDGLGDVFVTEGDEYDTVFFDKRSKFLNYRPDIAVINNLEFDHADIFDDLEAVKKMFCQLVRIVPQNGLILINGDEPNVQDVTQTVYSELQSFGFNESNDWRISDFYENSMETFFRLTFRGEEFGTFDSPVHGKFNALNLTVAIVIGHRLGMTLNQLKDGARSYRSPKRRMQEIGTWRDATVIDDFGHHPTAIGVTLEALRSKYEGRRLLVCFEPRSNTTTRSFFQNELVEAFRGVDALAIGALDRPERYSLDQRLDTSRLLHELGVPGMAIDLEQGARPGWGSVIRDWLDHIVQPNDVIVLFSNGDFGGLRALLSEPS